ncbi:MAG TPA: ASCH domain-containing protein [Phycisphaerales bacterium]|nr:ASCH domain-containing protein [Phycisphaerales bacterium]
MKHVAVLHEPYARDVLSGVKTVESRLSRVRCAPFGKVSVGDTIYIKVAGGSYVASAVADEVEYHENMTPREVLALVRRLNAQIRAPAGYWRSKRTARFATMIWLRDVRARKTGPRIPVLHGRGWLVLDDAKPRRSSRKGMPLA